MKGEWEYAIKPQFKLSNSKKEYIVAIPAEAFPRQPMQTDTSRQPIIKNGRIHFKEYVLLSTEAEENLNCMYLDLICEKRSPAS